MCGKLFMLFQSPVPLQRTEPPVMIYDTIKTKPVTVTPKSGYSTDKPTSLDPKLYQKFKLFQVNTYRLLLIMINF